MSSALDEYFAALERLRSKKPVRVSVGTRISNDAVALEAGRKKGSIKKSRPTFETLIAAIDVAASEQNQAANSEDKLARAKATAEEYRGKYEAALAREVSLVRELYSTRQLLAKLTGHKIVPLRKPEAPS